MSEHKTRLLIKAPLQRVWDIWVDVEKTPEWVHGVQSSEITAGGPGQGLCWKETGVVDGMPIPMEHSFLVWEPLHKTEIHTVLPLGGTMNRVVEFSENEEGTLVDVTMTWELGMIAMMISPEKIQTQIEESFEITAKNWKTKAES